GFTLAEVLITLAIIGVVAAISIPSVISNSQQQEFKTGLRKAVSVLNSAITMNIALDGETPYDNEDTFNYLQRHMSVMKSTSKTSYYYKTVSPSGGTISSGYNAAFYTTDGMRFEVDDVRNSEHRGPALHENKDIKTCVITYSYWNGSDTTVKKGSGCGGCGSLGLKNNPNNTTKAPCLLLVDVNGDRKPSPSNVNCDNSTCGENNLYKYPAPDAKAVSDIFAVMITESAALPYGVVSQKAMYQAQK
ncbi:MAG: type II secretion system protein, partial [bacterium]|nr:type II secretion system protein [bacterium]